MAEADLRRRVRRHPLARRVRRARADASSTTASGCSSAHAPACRRSSTWSASCSPAARCSAFGTAEQKAEHLEPTLRGDRVWCQLFSEPGAGSDLGGLSTTAERDGERFVVNGQKVWCSGGRYSDWGILMARTDAEAQEARGHLVLPVPDGPVRRRGAAAEADDRRGRVRRGVLHRRRPAGRAAPRPAPRRVGRRHGRADERARPHRDGDHRPRTPARLDGEARGRARPRAGRAPAAHVADEPRIRR